MKPVILTNLSVVHTNGRPVAVAVLRDLDEGIIRPQARIAEQLAFIKQQGFELTNSKYVLETLLMQFGFGA